jgi:cytochrome c-type biogenesis protein CcmH/NrfG
MARSAPPRPRATDAKAAAKVPPATRLSPTQQAELKDKLLVAEFLMDRHEYDGALDAFEAALKIDPSNPEALAGIKPARGARDVEKTNAQ